VIGEEQLNQFWNLFLENLRKIVHGFEMLVDPLKQRVQNEEISRKRYNIIIMGAEGLSIQKNSKFQG
jgi:hypothetical protein